jgi:uncharacterized membrane protein
MRHAREFDVLLYEWLLVLVVGLNIWADFMDRTAAMRSDAVALSLWTTISQFILVMPLVGLAGLLTPQQAVISASVGAFTALARIPWYRALSTPGAKLSRLAPFTRLSSVIVLILAFTLLGEAFSTTKFLGAILMVAGALMISLDRSFTSFRDYIASNRAISLVLIFAASMAVTSVFYKYMMNAGASVITTYFFLKLFQFAAAVSYGYRNNTLRRSFCAIMDIQLFVQARATQTIAAFLYLFVLRNADLSSVEPIAAAIGPLLYLIIDKASEWWASTKPLNGHASAQPEARSKRDYVAILGAVTISLGLYFMMKGR